MALLKQSTARNRAVFMTDSTDHVTGKTGLTLTITASKDGGSFSSITPTVTDLGSGWYKLALTTSHTDTLGDFALHITGTGADPTDLVDQVLTNIDSAGTANDIADAILKRDWTAVTGEANRSVLNALRFLRNKWSIFGATLTVTKEDDTTSAWTGAVTTSASNPVDSIDPT